MRPRTIRSCPCRHWPATRQVIAFEQQGYGRTADIADRPFSFEQSADDSAALLESLDAERADIFGFNNGGTIALQVAIRHPRALCASSWRRPGFHVLKFPAGSS